MNQPSEEPEPSTLLQSRQPLSHAVQWVVLVVLSPVIAIVVFLYVIIALPCLMSQRCSGQPDSARVRPSPREDGEFIASTSGLWLYHRHWSPSTLPVKGVIIVVHGLGEHISRPGYCELARRLTAAGFAVHGIDQAGHGHSTGERTYIDRFDTLVNDQLSLIQSLDGRYSADIPRFVFGHSLGSLIALHVLIKAQAHSQRPFAGVVLSSPAAFADPSVATPINVTAARILSKLAPKMGVDKLDPASISRSHEAVERYLNDPLIFHGKLKARFAGEILNAQSFLTARDALQLRSLTPPLLLLHGDDDRICPLQASQFVLSSIGSQLKHLEVFGGARHELFEDPDSAKFFAKIQEFFVQHAK